MSLDLFGYDRHGSIKECSTTLAKDALNTRDVALAALGFNAPAWIAAVSLPVLYAVVGAAAPVVLLVSFLFPMLVLALCLVYLTRQAPSAGGIFTFSSRFLHPAAGTILGWSYLIACAAVVPMTAVIGTQYLQALVPALRGLLSAKILSSALVLTFMLVCLRGVLLSVAFIGLRHLHLPKHAREANRCDQHHRGAQGGDQRIAPSLSVDANGAPLSYDVAVQDGPEAVRLQGRAPDRGDPASP